MMTKKVQWGILSTGAIARAFAAAVPKSATGELAAVASRDNASATKFAKEFNIPCAYGSYEALLADPAIQAVYIATPHPFHVEWVIKAAEAGKHILCEKPFGINQAETMAGIEAAREHGVFLMEAFMWRHQPRTLAVLEAVRSGRIGDLKLVRSSFSFSIDMTDWRLDPARGGGALWDVGCYGVSTLRLFAGEEPNEILARGRFSDRGVDLSVTASMKFPNGVLGAIDCSFEQPFRCVYEIVGSSGSIVVPNAYLPPETPIAQFYDTEGKLVEEVTYSGRNQYACMVDAFAESVYAGKLVAPAEDG